MSMTSGESGPIAPRVLVVDDEPLIAAAFRRILEKVGCHVTTAVDTPSALARIEVDPFDVIVSDLAMPGASGTEILRWIRSHDFEVPVIFITGAPSIETASLAVELGAYRYLTKPTTATILTNTVLEAARMHALTRAKTGDMLAARATLEEGMRSALDTLEMHYQPIVTVAPAHDGYALLGYEALMRPRSPAFAGPMQVLDAAEKLGTLHVLGRRIRSLVAAQIEATPGTSQFFVNLHAADLADDDLSDPQSPLSMCATRVVLEVTERASLEGVANLDMRLARLRQLGYRLAIDDLGAGYAGMSYFARVQPEFVKIDISLVRNIDSDPLRQRVLTSLSTLSRDLGMHVIAEGIETTAERDTVCRLGVTALQGYALARPGPAFPVVHWD